MDEFVRQQVVGDEQGIGNRASGTREGEAELDAPIQNLKLKNPKLVPLSAGQVATMFCLAGPDMPDVNDQAERRHVLLNETTAPWELYTWTATGCAQCHDHNTIA